MTTYQCFRFLRPSHSRIRIQYRLSESYRAVYLQFYSAARNFGHSGPKCAPNLRHKQSYRSVPFKSEATSRHEFDSPGLQYVSSITTRGNGNRQRIDELQAARALEYPRVEHDENAMTCAGFRNLYSSLTHNESRDGETVTIRGRVHSVRTAGSRLLFIDVVQDGVRVQGICNRGRLEALGAEARGFGEFCHLARRGDIVAITGTPSRTNRGELSLDAVALPTVLTPILASLPTTLEDAETRIRNRHADLLVNAEVADTLRLRSCIIQYLRNFLIADNFLEVQTPILADRAGGAIARPFVTTAIEFPDRQLSLRIAPEIWLKRLILGGMDRVFEIGPAFRNEGLDLTHNPEFTTCEFYKSFADIEELITMTEILISGLAHHANALTGTSLTSLPRLDINHFTTPFNRIEFVPALEAAIGRGLPNFALEGAYDELSSLFSDLSIPLPVSPSLPRLLDKLSSRYLESQCTRPTFIIHPPACLAPLAKSFLDPLTNQLVSARAELFVNSRELANMYEEENSPFEQRRKFLHQARWKDEENIAITDESYLEALEWGLPPTGGWGCGIDRLCMLFSGSSRISDVMSFGNLRNVVGLSQGT